MQSFLFSASHYHHIWPKTREATAKGTADPTGSLFCYDKWIKG